MTRLAIISPNKFKYSETFIHGHVERLEFERYLLHGGYLPQFVSTSLQGKDWPLVTKTWKGRELAKWEGLGLSELDQLLEESLPGKLGLPTWLVSPLGGHSSSLGHARPNQTLKAHLNALLWGYELVLPQPPPLGAMPIPVAQLKLGLLHFFQQARIEVVLAEYGPSGVAVMEVCTALGLPLVVHFHGYDAYREDILGEQGRLYPELFRQAAALVVVSEDMRRQLLSLGAPEEKIALIPYGVELNDFPLKGAGKGFLVDDYVLENPAMYIDFHDGLWEDLQSGDYSFGELDVWVTEGGFAKELPVELSPPHLVGVGRFTAKKAPQLTIQAFAQVVEEFPWARLTLAGEGELWQECHDLVVDLGLQDRVELPGALAPEAVADLLGKARAFVQHSIRPPSGDSEGLPLAVLEAMATGLPVVSTRHAGIPDAVRHGVEGWLCEPGDVQGMAKWMRVVLEDAEAACAMGRKGRSRVQGNYTHIHYRAVLEELIHDVVNTP